MKVVVTGAAGLVGQNLIPRLKARGGFDIVAIDKHAKNLAILRDLHPDIMSIEADLAQPGDWSCALDDADTVVIGHAQIGGLDATEFIRNNVEATERLLDALAARGRCHLVHLSSSVVNSAVTDWYTESKKAQEHLVLASGHPCIVLRPTLMFGWFDRKHLGWLARFMHRVPVFPIPGNGRYMRQPLYVGDFCNIVAAAIERRLDGTQHNISGQERVFYIDLIRQVKRATGASAAIVKVPYALFWTMLATYGLFDRNPPFTVKQLKALATPDEFEVIDWPALFGVRATPLAEALDETFRHPRYSSIALEF
jgi:nucleoside-diphosphate-sugar epimerase